MVRKAQRWNIVWVVPLVALLLGAWLLYRNFSAQGPVAEVRFETADGIFAGKTELRCRSVRVGYVRDVALADDLKSVIVYLELDSDASNLLRRGSRFWVVKPRITAAEVSGLGTLIQGAYIELDPGPPDAPRETRFNGNETPPATSVNVPGRRLVLSAEKALSVGVGSPVYYRGIEVGRIEGRMLTDNGTRVTYDAFVRDDYSHLVTDRAQFWVSSGIDIVAGADGVRLRTPSFQAMISGGVSFGLPDDAHPGNPVSDGRMFTLYESEDTARKSAFNPTLRFLLLFNQSVRGLAELAPVEFRGITIGRVARISFDLVAGAEDPRIPVLIELDPAMVRPASAEAVERQDPEFLRDEVDKGLRATLRTANLISGALFVDLDYYPDAPEAELERHGEFNVLPTVSSGFTQLEAKITAVLDKLNALPLEQAVTDITAAATEAKTTITEARATLDEIEAAAAAARGTLEDPSFRELPADLRESIAELRKSLASMGPDGAIQGDLLRALDELRASLRSIKSVTTTIDEKPNSLLFGRDSTGNPKPRAPR